MVEEAAGYGYNLEEILDNSSLNHSPRALWAEISYQEGNHGVVNPKRIDIESNREIDSVIEDLDTYCDKGLLERTQKGQATPNYRITDQGGRYLKSHVLEETHLLSDADTKPSKLMAD